MPFEATMTTPKPNNANPANSVPCSETLPVFGKFGSFGFSGSVWSVMTNLPSLYSTEFQLAFNTSIVPSKFTLKVISVTAK